MNNRRKSLLIGLLLVFAFLSIIPVALAQRTETYISPEGDWQVEVPRGFDIEENRDGTVTIVGEEFDIQFFGPVVLDELGYSRVRDPQDLIEDYADDEGFEITELDFSGDVEGVYVVIYGKGRIGYVAIGKVFTNDELGLALITVQSDASDDAFGDSFEVVGTFNAAEGGSREGGSKDETTGGGEPAAELRDFDGDWEDAIAELEDEGMIASGGQLIFEENSAFVASNGFTYTPLASRADFQNVIIAGELTFDPDGRDFQTCSLAARVETNSRGGTDIFMEVGFDNEGNFYVYDVFGTGRNDTIYETPVTLDQDEPHHILALIIDDEITLYLDGELVNEDPITVTERSGSFGIMMRSESSDSRCDGANLWAYALPSGSRGSNVCEATADGNINKREGPGTNFDRAGQLRGGDPTEVIAFAEGDDDFIWYQLEDETWVREDLIELSGPCDDLPEER